MVRKKTQKTGKRFKDENITNHCQGEKMIYWKKYIWEKKEKANLVIPIEKKNSKDKQLVGKNKKAPPGLLSYNAKSARY